MHIDLMRDKSKVMPPIENPEKVKSIRIWHCKYKSFEQLSELINLEVAVFASLPESNFNFLEHCLKLKHLSVVHLPKIRDLSPLQSLNNLETVSLSTLPSWDASGKVSVVTSLAPFALLPHLKYIELFGVITENKSPNELASCKTLKSVKLSKYSKKLSKQFYEQTGINNGYAPAPEFKN